MSKKTGSALTPHRGRYDITSEEDKREALRRTQEDREQQPAVPPNVAAGDFGRASG